MTTPASTIPALPSFTERAAALPQMPAVPAPPFTQQVPAFPVPPSPMNAPSGGANSPPAPVSQPGGLGLPSQTPAAPLSLVQQYEAAGRIPAGRFKSDQELTDALYQVAETAASELEQSRQRPQTPAAEPAKPVTPAAPIEDVTKMATYFQQNGWLSLQNGQWVAVNPLATQLAGQLNQQIVEAQARQAELADPVSFFKKYGGDALKENLTPMQAELAELKAQYAALQTQIAESAPKPWDGFMKQYDAQLWTTDQSGQRQPSDVGRVYRDAFEMARTYGMSPVDTHKFAETATKPYLQQTQQPVAPQQSWMQQVSTNQAQMDPSFNRPGTVLNNGVPPGQMGIPRENNGFTSFNILAQLPQ